MRIHSLNSVNCTLYTTDFHTNVTINSTKMPECALRNLLIMFNMLQQNLTFTSKEMYRARREGKLLTSYNSAIDHTHWQHHLGHAAAVCALPSVARSGWSSFAAPLEFQHGRHAMYMEGDKSRERMRSGNGRGGERDWGRGRGGGERGREREEGGKERGRGRKGHGQFSSAVHLL